MGTQCLGPDLVTMRACRSPSAARKVWGSYEITTGVAGLGRLVSHHRNSVKDHAELVTVERALRVGR